MARIEAVTEIASGATLVCNLLDEKLFLEPCFRPPPFTTSGKPEIEVLALVNLLLNFKDL